jgi:hypothetical protein
MVTKIIFKLREPQHNVKTPSKQKASGVVMYFSFGYSELTVKGHKKYIPLKYSTEKSIKPQYWNDKPDYRAKQTKHFDYNTFNTGLDNLQNAAKKIHGELINKGINPTPENIRQALDIEFNRNDPTELPKTLNLYIERFVKDCESGARTTEKKTRYSKGSIKNIKSFETLLNLYQKKKNRRLNFDNITLDFYEDFISFLNKKSYSPNTLGRVIKHLKLIMRAARDQGLHNNNEFERRAFKTPSVEVANIYLTETELKEMLKLDLSESPHLEQARDVFLIGCYTAQRFSDYSRIRKDHINNGFIELIQQKTGAKVVIPIRPELEILLKKYDYNVPKTYEQKLNKYIKTVGKKAKIKEPVIIEAIRGGLKVETTKPKHDFIKTHTARRSGCTNMFDAGLNTLVIMKISGHKTEKEFLKYIKLSEKQAAEKAAQHPYFSGSLLKIAK